MRLHDRTPSTWTLFTGLAALALLAVALVACPASRVNHAPEAHDQTVITSQDTPVDVTLNVTGEDDDDVTYAITRRPGHGTLSGTAPDVTYAPDAGFNGADAFTYTASDGHLTSATATVTITVTAAEGAHGHRPTHQIALPRVRTEEFGEERVAKGIHEELLQHKHVLSDETWRHARGTLGLVGIEGPRRKERCVDGQNFDDHEGTAGRVGADNGTCEHDAHDQRGLDPPGA